MQPTGDLFSKTTLTAIFMSNRLDATLIQQTIRHMKQIASELTIVMTDSTFPKDTDELSKDRFFFVPPTKGSANSNLSAIVTKALELSPNSERFLIFLGDNSCAISDEKFAKLENRNDDFALMKDIQCIVLSKKYASYVASSGETPSTRNAISNGFSSTMSFKQIVSSPRDAMRQYARILKFATVGASGVVVNLLLLTLLKIWMAVVFANIVAVELSIVNNFVWNDRYTFGVVVALRGQTKNFKSRLNRFVKYNGVSLASLGVNEVVFFFAYSNDIWYVWSSILAIGAAFVVNYTGSSRWAWRQSFLETRKSNKYSI